MPEEEEPEEPKKGTKEELADKLKAFTGQDIEWEALKKEDLEKLVGYYSHPRRVIRDTLTSMVDIQEKLSLRELGDRMGIRAEELLDTPIGKFSDKWDFPILGALLKKVL